jgi:hypothetical protein
MLCYCLVFAAPCLRGVALMVAAVRAPREHQRDIVRAIMRIPPRDDEEDDAPSLPKP